MEDTVACCEKVMYLPLSGLFIRMYKRYDGKIYFAYEKPEGDF